MPGGSMDTEVSFTHEFGNKDEINPQSGQTNYDGLSNTSSWTEQSPVTIKEIEFIILRLPVL
jgi:hypothetical protein